MPVDENYIIIYGDDEVLTISAGSHSEAARKAMILRKLPEDMGMLVFKVSEGCRYKVSLSPVKVP
jgi:hypothetical protein